MKWRSFLALCISVIFLSPTLRGQGAASSAPAAAPGAAADIPPACSVLVKAIADVRQKGSDEINLAIADSLKLRQNSVCVAQILAEDPHLGERPSFSNFVKTLENQRIDKQAGPSAGTGGTTDLVSKGVTAKAISVAADYGALTESTSNKTVTVQGSLEGIAAAAIRQNLFRYCPDGGTGECADDALLRGLGRVSYGITFNPNLGTQSLTGTPSGSQTGSAQPVTFTASGSEISAADVKFVLIPEATTSKAFQTAWNDALSPVSKVDVSSKTTLPDCAGKGSTAKKAGQGGQAGAANAGGASSGNSLSLLDAAGANLVASLSALIQGVNFEASNEYIQLYKTEAVPTLQNAVQRGASQAELGAIWRQEEDKLIALAKKLDPQLEQQAASLLQNTARYQLEEREFVACIADQPVLTAEYDYNHSAGQIPTSTVRLIFSKGLGANFSVTANGAAAIYDSQPMSSIPGGRRLRDVQAGVEADWKLGALALVGAPVVSATGYFQDQTSPAILNVNPAMPITGITFTGLPSNAMQVFAKKGNIGIAQLKLTLGSGKSSVRVPFAISYSNRTELITRPEWKAQVGISYDFDSLFTSAGSGKTGQ